MYLSIPESNSKVLPFEEKDLNTGNFGTLRERLSWSPKNNWNESIRPRIIGLDTETYTDASPIITADSDGRILEGSRTITEIFNWLSAHDRTFYMCWNLSFDAMILLGSVPDLGKRYRETEDGKRFDFEVDGIKVRYLYKKALEMSSTRLHKSVKIYDAAQLYGKIKLEEAGQKFLGRGKLEIGTKRFERGNIDIRKITEYSIQDAILCRDLANRWVDTFFNEFGYYPSMYYSSGSIISEYLEKEIRAFPTFTVASYSVQDAAYRAYYGGRFEIFKRGKFSNIWKYDINSAYPFAITQMPDFTNGEWKKYYPADWNFTDAGFFEIDANIPRTLSAGPFMFRIGNKVICPVGRFRTWVTLAELKAVEPSWFKIRQGWQFYQSENATSDLRSLVQNMYRIRLTKEEPEKTVYKILINAIYGKTAQVKPKVGKLFSPIVASFITGFTRAQLWQALQKGKPGQAIALATDAILTSEQLNLPISKEMGDFTLETYPDLTIFMNGVYFLGNKARTRGFSPKVMIDGELQELTLELVRNKLKLGSKLGKNSFEIQTIKPNPLKDSLNRGRIPGKFEENTRIIDLNADTKRLWQVELDNLEASQISYPIALDW